MSVSICFVYETENKESLEVAEGGYQGLQDLFELHFASEDPDLKNSILNPPFVQDFPKLQDVDEEEDELTEEEIVELMSDGIDPYIGPTFDAEELVVWADTWIDIIQDLNEEERRVALPLTTDGHDWTPTLLEDLKEISAQGRCAQRHGIQMHIEMF